MSAYKRGDRWHVRFTVGGKQFSASLGVALEQISDVAQAVRAAGLKAGLKPGTINRRLSVLRRVANLAHDEWGWLREPIGKRIKMLPGEQPPSRSAAAAQIEEADTCQRGPRWRLARTFDDGEMPASSRAGQTN